MGARMMAIDWRRGPDWLRLRLAPVTPVACLGCIPTFWGDASTLTLHRAGEMEVHLGGKDCASLIALSPGETVDRDLLQTNVAAAAAEAFARLRKGDVNDAERALGMHLPRVQLKGDAAQRPHRPKALRHSVDLQERSHSAANSMGRW